MKCYHCKKEINATGGMMEFPMYSMKEKKYLSKMLGMIIECPNCQSMIILVDYSKKNLKIKIDKSKQSNKPAKDVNANQKKAKKSKKSSKKVKKLPRKK